MRNLNDNQRDSKSPADRIEVDSGIFAYSVLIPTNLCFSRLVKIKGHAKITSCLHGSRCSYLTLHNGNPVQQLRNEHILLCNFCSQWFNLWNFVCFRITIIVSWKDILVWVHFVYMLFSLLIERTVSVNPHLLYHVLDLPLLREHHVVEMLYSLSQFCCFCFQLLRPEKDHAV